MSYYCNITLVRATSELDAFHKAQEVMRFLKTESGCRWYVKENLYYIARDIRGFCKKERPSVSDCYTLMQRHFNITFVYYPELKLLGCTNPAFPKVFPKAKTLYFQNSCDQNYDREDWKNIKALNAIYDKWTTCSREDIIATGHWELEEIVNDEDLDYCRKTLAYYAIEELLGIQSYLYGKDDDAYIRFCMTPLDSQEAVFDIGKEVLSQFLQNP